MWWAYWASSFWRSSDSISTFFYYSLNLFYIHVFRRCCQIVVRLSRLSINQCFPRQGTPSIKEKPKFWDLEDGVPISTILQISASAFQQFWGMRWGARDKQMHSLVKPRQSHIISLSVLLFCFSPSPAFLMAIEFVEFTPLLTHTRVQSLSAQSGLLLVQSLVQSWCVRQYLFFLSFSDVLFLGRSGLCHYPIGNGPTSCTIQDSTWFLPSQRSRAFRPTNNSQDFDVYVR